MSRGTIFDYHVPPKHTWVQVRVNLAKGGTKRLSLRITQAADDAGPRPGAYEITDFRAPEHAEINWAWIEKHKREVWQAIEFDQ